MALDQSFLCELADVPSVATACGPVLNTIRRTLQRKCHMHVVADSHALVTFRGVLPRELRLLLVCHVDEIGGVVLGQAGDGTYHTRWWGAPPEVFAGEPLQAWDYLAAEAFTSNVQGVTVDEAEEVSLRLAGDEIRSYRTAWTFARSSEIADGWITGKALDPRAALFAVLSAFWELRDPSIGVLLVMAEECCMDQARKAVQFLMSEGVMLRGIVNVDVPDVRNLEAGSLETPYLRLWEGRRMVDPSFALDVAQRLKAAGIWCPITASRTGSQTSLFQPLAPCLSVALPGDNVHTAHTRVNLTAIDRTVRLLCAICQAVF